MQRLHPQRGVCFDLYIEPFVVVRWNGDDIFVLIFFGNSFLPNVLPKGGSSPGGLSLEVPWKTTCSWVIETFSNMEKGEEKKDR